MEKKDILKALEFLRRNSKKRNFDQSIDLVVNLRNLNLKKPEENVNFFVTLPYSRGKKSRVCAFVGEETADKAKEVCDGIILKNEFSAYSQDKKKSKDLVKQFTFFIAQANLMPDIARTFGKVLGPRGLMPDPKAGCLFAPGANLKPLVERLQKTVRLQTKNELIVKTIVGIESMKYEEIVENIFSVYNTLIHSLPQGKANVRNIIVKLTMGKPVRVGEKFEEKVGVEEKPKEEKKEPERKVEKKVEEEKEIVDKKIEKKVKEEK